MFERLPHCPFFCNGHVDESSTHTHTTDLDYFAENGPVTVTQVDGAPPVVSLVELPSPQADFSPMRARQVAYQMLLAADIADRAASATETSTITRLLGEALATSRGAL